MVSSLPYPLSGW